jgi:hypothetical protein
MAMTADDGRNIAATPVRQRSRSVPRHPQQNMEEENMGSYDDNDEGFASYFSSRSGGGGSGRERSGEYRGGGSPPPTMA